MMMIADSRYKKIIAVFIVSVAVANLLFLALGIIQLEFFWIILIVCTALTYIFFPKKK